MIASSTRLAAALLSALVVTAPTAAFAQSAQPTPHPKISVAPKTLKHTKYKQDTMIKRSQRHPEATSGTSASSENPSSPQPNPIASPH